MRRFSLPGSIVIVAAAAALTAGCSQPSAVPDTGAAPAEALRSSLLASGQLPGEFVAVPADLNEYILANRELYERAAQSRFDPEGCRPTADAEFNNRITTSDTAMLAARDGENIITELLSTVDRDVSAFARSVTGECANVRVSPGAEMSATRSTVTRSRELTESRLAGKESVEQSVIVRQESVTEYGDGGRRTRIQYAAALRVQRSGGEVVSLQLNASGPVSTGDGAAAEPLSDREFLDLVVGAVGRAER